jgi:transposase InsO family protein
MEEEKAKDPRVSVPELIRRAREHGFLGRHDSCNRTTVYRALKRLGVPVSKRKKAKDHDARRFAYPHRMDMILCDGKHFRAGAGRSRRVVFFFLDDATRLALHAVVGTSENALLFQRGLFETITKHGLFDIIYLDRGPGFIAEDSIAVVANLDRLLIHGERAYPEGHGKLERFNQTALRHDLLRGLDRRPDVDPALGALELRIRHYLDTQYNPRVHESLGGKSPSECFAEDPKPLRFRF